jgi:hypothetical protein
MISGKENSAIWVGAIEGKLMPGKQWKWWKWNGTRGKGWEIGKGGKSEGSTVAGPKNCGHQTGRRRNYTDAHEKQSKTGPKWTTAEEAARLAREIRQDYVMNHQLFTSDDFQTLIIDRHL